MDTAYFAIGGKTDHEVYSDFKGSLSVLTTIDSKRHTNQATIDYGNKAMLRTTDKVKGMPWIQVGPQGAEYGMLSWKRVEIYCTNLDTSTNCYDRYYVAKGDQIVDVWPIMGRGGAAQR
jgi:D-serine deaminase-like pyridoxal phosphate-dependent protein